MGICLGPAPQYRTAEDIEERRKKVMGYSPFTEEPPKGKEVLCALWKDVKELFRKKKQPVYSEQETIPDSCLPYVMKMLE